MLRNHQGFPDSSVVKNPPVNIRNMGLILDPLSTTFLGATKLMHHNYWACALESGSRNYWAHMLQLLKAASSRAHAQEQEKPLQWESHAP